MRVNILIASASLLAILAACSGSDEPGNAGNPNLFVTYVHLEKTLEPIVFDDIGKSGSVSQPLMYGQHQEVEYEASSVRLSEERFNIQATKQFASMIFNREFIQPTGKSDFTIFALDTARIERIIDEFVGHQPGKAWARVVNCNSEFEMITVVMNGDTITKELEYLSTPNDVSVASPTYEFFLVDTGNVNFEVFSSADLSFVTEGFAGMAERDVVTYVVHNRPGLGNQGLFVFE
ncbi:MAG: hypothetical protein AAGC47_12725 [Bacteroidota bacterium]